jgi:hypothetical protein
VRERKREERPFRKTKRKREISCVGSPKWDDYRSDLWVSKSQQTRKRRMHAKIKMQPFSL